MVMTSYNKLYVDNNLGAENVAQVDLLPFAHYINGYMYFCVVAYDSTLGRT